MQRQHNYAFFDPYLPEHLRRGPCRPYIPYEDLETAEFRHTAKLGKELYGAGEVFWAPCCSTHWRPPKIPTFSAYASKSLARN
ncbi:MAG: hypothetical protein U0521_01885 [Anaerolineae bacterium]